MVKKNNFTTSNKVSITFWEMYYCQKPRDTFLKEIEKISNKVQTIGYTQVKGECTCTKMIRREKYTFTHDTSVIWRQCCGAGNSTKSLMFCDFVTAARSSRTKCTVLYST